MLTPIPCREDFASAAEAHFRITGRAAEIGVNQGIFASHNLKSWSGEYWAIDAWAQRPRGHGWTIDNPTDQMQAIFFNRTKASVEFAGSRVRLLKAFSQQAAKQFPDGHFDWIYVDALHSEHAVAEDLNGPRKH